VLTPREENADSVLQDKTFLADLKADILRRAAEVSDEEEEWLGEDEGRRRRPFTDVEDIDDDMSTAPRIKIGGDEGEDVDDQEEKQGLEVR
jgi:activating signal cointegrator complex subunit 2